MPNTYFQFKQFRIEQEHCAMKVCTDSCIQGAYAAKEVIEKKTESILDIGAGTGLLSLMLAQNHTFKKQDTIEINKLAYEQAKENFKNNALGKDICSVFGDIRLYKPDYLYDCIICNPPFYENSLKSPSSAKRQAMHAQDLSYEELLQCARRLLKKEGIFNLMLPSTFENEFLKKAKDVGLFPYKIVRVMNNIKKQPFRSILFLARTKQKIAENAFIIRDVENAYTKAFTALLKPYYFNF